jgi:hypothetical protein
MNDDFSDLEAELQRLRPREPSPALRARLAAALDQPATSAPSRFSGPHVGRSWSWILWPVATTAAVALIVVVGQRQGAVAPGKSLSNGPVVVQASAPAADLYKPVSTENVLYDSRDEGFVTLADGTAARRVFQRYLDTYTWRNPRTNASLRWTVPRDEVRIVPVSAY